MNKSKKEKKKEGANNKKKFWIFLGSLIAILAGIAGLSGLSLKDIFKSQKSLELAIGNTYVNEKDECSVVFAFYDIDFNYPCVVGLPITIKNNSKSTAKNIDLMIKYEAPLKAYPTELSKTNSLGIYNNISRVTSEVGDVSTSSISISSIAPEKSIILIDAILWEKNISKIDTSMTIDITVNVEDRPSRNQKIKIWSSFMMDSIPGGMMAINKNALKVDHGILVYFKNYKLMKSKKNNEMIYNSYSGMQDVIFQEMKTEQ
jgi:hypothetical protein